MQLLALATVVPYPLLLDKSLTGHQTSAPNRELPIPRAVPPWPAREINYSLNVHICWCNFWSSDVATSETSLRLCPGLQNKKDLSGVGRWSLLWRSSQSSVCMERREKEREEERARENRSSFNNFYTPMYYMPVLPLSSARLHVDVF
jgi:hypothetical protein